MRNRRGDRLSAVRTRRRPALGLLALAVLLLAVGVLWWGGGTAGEGYQPEESISREMPAVYAVPSETQPQEGRPLVCIDPGHGGNDRGTSQGELEEADQNLALALTLRDELLRRGMGVVMTRETDDYIGLAERADIANAAGADYYISLHRNSVEGGGAQGIEVWYSHQAGEQTLYFADCVEEALIRAGVTKSRGCRGGSAADPNQDYAVCRLTQMPAVLVEMGFITDEEDNRLFERNQSAYAAALADAAEKAWAEQQA